VDPFSRSSWPLWGAVLTVAAADAVWLDAAGIGFRDGGLFWTRTIALLGACAVVLRFGFDLPRLGASCRRFSRSCHTVALILSFGAACMVMDYLVAGLRFQLIDRALIRSDAALGFDWHTSYIWISARPFVSTTLLTAYATLLPQIAIAPLLLSGDTRCADAREFILLLFVTALVATAISGLLPALGKAGMLGPAHITPIISARNGMLHEISLGDIEGIVTFPSWHAAMGVVLAYSLSKTGRAGVFFFVPLNGLMIAATPAVGGHHLADTLAGCALATVAIIFVRHARRADAPNVSSLRPMSDVRRSRSSLNSGRRPKA
jgi:PAP2 superfamily protein